MINKDVINKLKNKYELISNHLNERSRRIWAASEAKLLGHGGVAAVSKATGLSRVTINFGLNELQNKALSLYL